VLFLIAAALYNGLVKSDKGTVTHLKSMMFFTPPAGNPTATNRRYFPEVWAAEHADRVARRLVDVLGTRGATLRIATVMSFVSDRGRL
jgi:hypothetical protein